MIEKIPSARVFLDVDDMLEGNGESYLNLSMQVLVFASAGYFESQNCMRELLRAYLTKKPIIVVLDSEVKHGGLTRHQILEELRHVHAERLDSWTLRAEVKEWEQTDGTGPMPSAEELWSHLFSRPVIEWNRIGPFQDVTIRLIADRLLDKNDFQSTYVPAELVHQVVLGGIPKLELPHAFHVYTSPHNLGAANLMAQMALKHDLTLKARPCEWRSATDAMIQPQVMKQAGPAVSFCRASSISTSSGARPPRQTRIAALKGRLWSHTLARNAEEPLRITERIEDLPRCKAMLVCCRSVETSTESAPGSPFVLCGQRHHADRKNTNARLSHSRRSI